MLVLTVPSLFSVLFRTHNRKTANTRQVFKITMLCSVIAGAIIGGGNRKS